MPDVHRLVPLGLADREQPFAALIDSPEDHDVDFVAGLGCGIWDGPGPDAGPAPAERAAGRIPARPAATELLEVGPDDLAAEGGLCVVPYLVGVADPFEITPVGPHDRVVEGE